MRLTFLIALALLGGCVDESAMLTNSSGQTFVCAHQGWGWLGAPVAASEQHSCVNKAEAAGYHEAGTPQPAEK